MQKCKKLYKIKITIYAVFPSLSRPGRNRAHVVQVHRPGACIYGGSSHRSWTRVYCVYVLPLVPLRPRASAFIADFSGRYPSAVSRRSRSRGPQDAFVARRTMRVPVSHEDVYREPTTPRRGAPAYAGRAKVGLDLSMHDSRSREVRAAHEQQGWPCGCASKCIVCIRQLEPRLFPAHWFQLVSRLVCIVQSLSGAYLITLIRKIKSLLAFSDLKIGSTQRIKQKNPQCRKHINHLSIYILFALFLKFKYFRVFIVLNPTRWLLQK